MTDTAPPTAPARDPRRATGELGESIAEQYLCSLGYRILARNWRAGRRGELDLIARDGGYVVAVEVKTRRGTGYGHPLEAITAQKASRLRRLLHVWVREAAPGAVRLRIDAIGVTLRPGERARIDHVRGI